MYMTEWEDFTQKTQGPMRRANDAMMAGDPEPYIECRGVIPSVCSGLGGRATQGGRS